MRRRVGMWFDDADSKQMDSLFPRHGADSAPSERKFLHCTHRRVLRGVGVCAPFRIGMPFRWQRRGHEDGNKAKSLRPHLHPEGHGVPLGLARARGQLRDLRQRNARFAIGMQCIMVLQELRRLGVLFHPAADGPVVGIARLVRVRRPANEAQNCSRPDGGPGDAAPELAPHRIGIEIARMKLPPLGV